MRISDWSSDVCSSDLFGKSAMRAAGILTVGVAALAAGQQLTTGWNVMAMDVPAAWATTAVQDMAELRQIQQKAILSLERSEEHTSELQSLMRISYAVFCLKKKNKANVELTTRQTEHSKSIT